MSSEQWAVGSEQWAVGSACCSRGLGRIMRCITQRSNVPSAESSKGSRHLASQVALSEGWGHAPRSGTAASYADTMASLRS